MRLEAIGLGTADLGNLHGAISDEDAWAILDAAWSNGIRYFDTAPHYGLGLAERRLGAFLRTKPRRDYMVSTKVGRLLEPNGTSSHGRDTEGFDVPAAFERVWDLSAAGVRRSHEASLDRLGLDYIDILYLHDPERHDLGQGLCEALPELARLRDEGMVFRVGVGSMSTDALAQAARSGHADTLMVAGRYTLAEQPALDEVMPVSAAAGIDIVVASVFNSGLLASDDPVRAALHDYEAAPAALLRKVDAIRSICHSNGIELPAAALQFASRGPAVASVLIAGRQPEHIVQNVHRLRTSVPEQMWLELAAAGLVSAT